MQRLAEEIASINPETRARALEEVESFTQSRQWIGLFEAFEGATLGTLRVMVTLVSQYLPRARHSEITPLLRYLYTQGSPLLHHFELVRRLLEVYLTQSRISEYDKISTMTVILSDHIDADPGKKPIPKEVTIYIIRALGILKARSALPVFERFLHHEEKAFVFETIRALRFIRDRSARRLLESVFEFENREFAVAAVEAYEAIGLGRWRLRRLGKMYLQGSSNLKRSILAITLGAHPDLASRMLIGFFRNEESHDLKYQIIKKLQTLPVARTAWFLMDLVHHEKNPQLRIVADWALEALPAKKLTRVIRAALKSKSEPIQKWAFLKASALAPSRAKRFLKPFLLKELPPLVHLALVEAVARLPSDPELDRWLINQIGGDSLASQASVVGLFRRSEPPAEFVLHLLEFADTPTLKSALALLPEHPETALQPEVVKLVKRFLAHPDPEIAYLSARLMVRTNDESLFYTVWRQARKTDPKDWEPFATMIGHAMGDFHASPLWIPHEKEDELEYKLLARVLSHVRTGTWGVDRWRLMMKGLVGSARRLDPYQGRIVKEFLSNQGHFWGEILDKLIIAERDPEYLRVICVVAGLQKEPFRPDTVDEILHLLMGGAYESSEGSILALLAVMKERRVLPQFIDWVMSLESSKLKAQAFRCLLYWVRETSPSSPQEELAVG